MIPMKSVTLCIRYTCLSIFKNQLDTKKQKKKNQKKKNQNKQTNKQTTTRSKHPDKPKNQTRNKFKGKEASHQFKACTRISALIRISYSDGKSVVQGGQQ